MFSLSCRTSDENNKEKFARYSINFVLNHVQSGSFSFYRYSLFLDFLNSETETTKTWLLYDTLFVTSLFSLLQTVCWEGRLIFNIGSSFCFIPKYAKHSNFMAGTSVVLVLQMFLF